MQIAPEQIQELALKWLKGEASPEEVQQLFNWYNEHQEADTFIADPLLYDEEELRARMLMNLSEVTGAPFVPQEPMPVWNRTWFKVAASVIVIATAALWFHNYNTQSPPVQIVAVTTNLKDLGPGGEKALLTLADGKKVILDETQNGKIGREADIDIVKDNGKVSYIGKSDSESLVYNTISTPRKGQYHLVLADGTGVWLDAESSIRFPVVFNGPERTVQVTGQAYFEIAKDAAKPFHVKVPLKEIAINVLGTHFNIMAYADEASVKTTLVEGAVNVNTGSAVTLLKPGQQALVKQGGSIQLIRAANIDQVMAWKNGMFNLGGTPIEEIMRQVARWYDAEIVYQGDVSKLVFSGEISRKQQVSDLLKILEATGTIQFKIEDHKITVISVK